MCVCVCVCRKEREGVCVEGKNGSSSFNCVVSHIEPDVFYCVHLLHIQYSSILVYNIQYMHIVNIPELCALQ